MIENTARRDPLLHALGVLSDSDAYITGMEAAGQRQLVASTSFPTAAPIADLEALGFTFGPVDEADPLFRPATLPQGWSREGSDHAMWSYILDGQGRRRVAIFYKAAFYDRSASASIVHPAAPLTGMIYGDVEPTTIELDDLLTEQIARDYLDRQLADVREALGSYMAGDARYESRAARIERMLAMLPDGAA